MKRTKQVGLAMAIMALVALVAVPAGAYAKSGQSGSNAACQKCHTVAANKRGVPKTYFSDTVSYAKCANCHWLSGRTRVGRFTHQHGLGQVCGSCHSGYGNAGGAYPAVRTVAGYYATSNYRQRSAAAIHGAHVGGSWIASVDPRCASCHAPAACDACHVVPAKHAAHAKNALTGATPYGPVTAVTAWGTPVNTNAITAKATSSYCVNPACHSVSDGGARVARPICTSCHVPRPVAAAVGSTTKSVKR
jgi:hypothetical protein